jgi:ABC-2 type transport system ATP-binding protein
VMSQVLKEKCADGVPCVFSSHQLDLVERLCDRVGIVRGGHMVACGAIDELRAGGSDQLVVHAPHAAEGWADAIGGVTVTGHEAGRTILELTPGTDDQLVLRAALATGPVHEFTRRRPSLTELFRNVVSEHGTDNHQQGRAA